MIVTPEQLAHDLWKRPLRKTFRYDLPSGIFEKTVTALIATTAVVLVVLVCYEAMSGKIRYQGEEKFHP
jgi:hypothetical protein